MSEEQEEMKDEITDLGEKLITILELIHGAIELEELESLLEAEKAQT